MTIQVSNPLCLANSGGGQIVVRRRSREGGEGNDTLGGEGGSDQVFGGEGNDMLSGDEDGDSLLGQDGNDIYYVKAVEGVDRISDWGGNDRLVLDGVSLQDVVLGTGSLKITIPGGEIHLEDFDADNPFAPGGIETFQFAGGMVLTRQQLITTLGMKPTRTSGADMVRGTALADAISALEGDDFVLAAAGADTVDGGAGNDMLLGGSGNDDLFGDDFTVEGLSYTLAGTAHGRDTLDGAGSDVQFGSGYNAFFDHSYSVRLQDGTALRIASNLLADCDCYSQATGRFDCQKLRVNPKRQSLKCGLKPQTGKTSHACSMRIAGHKWLGMPMECARLVSFGHALRSIKNRGQSCVA
jgi:Ca2+-binding RTX toxin-like protein